MSRQSSDKTITKSYREFLEEPFLQWNSDSSAEEPIFNSKSEVLWSREKNILQGDFFRGLQNGFSNLTEGSTSSCSWHNDDFDMNSGNKVKASLEAIEDVLYEGQESSLISETVFQECCDWSRKFPFFRLKGENILDIEEGMLPFSSQQNLKSVPSSLSSLLIEGKKMAIHALEKSHKKTVSEKALNDPNSLQPFVEETFADDGDYKEENVFNIGDTCNKRPLSKLLGDESENVSSDKIITDKIIEKLALEIWPKVLAVLENLDDSHTTYANTEFQLPPIVSVVKDEGNLSHPRTEGTDICIKDFPKLDSFLSISPKVLQSKHDYGSWRSTHGSRPNSEIHLAPRNRAVSKPKTKLETQNFALSRVSKSYNDKQALHPKVYKEKEIENVSLLLPSVHEEILETTNVLKNICIGSDWPERASACDLKRPVKSPAFYLPPIDSQNCVSSNVKLAQNLFTFFGSPFKHGNHNGSRPATRPTACPNTSSFRNNFKHSASLKNKLINEKNVSSRQSQSLDVKMQDDKNLEKPVTLLPIVTSLLPPKDRNSSSGKKLGLRNTLSGRKR